MGFNETKNDPNWAWRRPVIAYHAARALRGVVAPRILEIGCNEGENLLAVRELVPSAWLDGLDHKAHTPPIDRFRRLKVADFLNNQLGADHWDLVLVCWIYIHTTDAPWENLLPHCGRILTFENEQYIAGHFPLARPVPAVFGAGRRNTHTETFQVLDGTPQTLRVFE